MKFKVPRFSREPSALEVDYADFAVFRLGAIRGGNRRFKL